MYKNVKLSNEAERVLAYVKRYIKTRGYAPTQQEISQHVYSSKYTVSKALLELESAGIVKKQRHKARTLTVKGLKVVEEVV